MTLHLQLLSHDDELAHVDLREVSSESEPLVAVEELESVQTVADMLDRVRVICAELGPATLLAELHGTSSEVICAAFDGVVRAGMRALTTLYSA